MNKDVVLLFSPKPSPGDHVHARVPYALLYLERMLRDVGVEPILVDEQIQPDYSMVLAEKRERLLLAGVSSMTGHQIHGGIAFSKRVREMCGAPIVWGGWHPSLLPEQTLREAYVDFVVVGQGERPLRQLVDGIRNGKDTSDIRGLGFKRGNAITVNPAAPLEPTDSLAPINLGLLDLEKYIYRNGFAERCLGYFASHGCPFNCAYCCVAAIYRNRWYRKPISQIIEDLRYLKEQASIDSISFDDDNFFVGANFARQLAQSMIEAKLDLRWETSAQAGSFVKAYNDEDLRLFVKAGCRQIYIGAESGDQETLNILGKGTKVEENLRFVEMLKRHSIIPQMSTMVCIPDEPTRGLDLTIDMIRRAKLLDRRLRASVFLYTPYPGTKLYERAKGMGFSPPQHLEDWASHTLRKFESPWASEGVKRRLEYFVNFFLPMVDPQFYRVAPSTGIRTVLFLVNKLFFPLAWLRFAANCFRCPAEAIVFLRLLRFYNKLTGANFSLGHESYLK